MSQIKTLEQFRDFLKRELGAPVSIIEVDDTQFNQIIDRSVQEFCRYNYSDATYLEYAIFNCSAGQAYYNMSGQNIEGVFDIQLSIGVDGINTLFSPTNVLLYSDFVKQGGVFSDVGGYNASPGMIMATYETALLYLEQIRQTFGAMYTVRWIPGKETLVISPTPTQNITGVIYLYRKEDAINLYNHPLLQKLCTARCKKQWGWNLLKYEVDMPEGAKINASKIYDEGKEDEKTALEDLKKESAPPDFFLA